MMGLLLAGTAAVLAVLALAAVAQARLAVRSNQRLEGELAATRVELGEMEDMLFEVNRELADMVVDRERRSLWLQEARARAEEASRSKSRFLASMSHELRTPLNSVIGFSNQLLKNKDGRLTERDLLYLRKIADNGAHLLGLIDEILDLAKIEAGRTQAVMEPTCLASIVHEVVEQLEGQTLDRPVELLADVPRDMAPLDTDDRKLKQILINLVGNAIKFTERGEIRVVARTDENGRPATLEVVDDGIGIPPDRLEKIFEVFEQADATTSRTHGGTGLGLALSRSLCELMGYGIEAESVVGAGSTFRITFPTGPRLSSGSGPARPPASYADGELAEA